MKHTLRKVFRSPKFLFGFVIFMAIFLTMIVYPMLVPGHPLEMIGKGPFSPPGTYVSLYDGLTSPRQTFVLGDADDKRLAMLLSEEDRVKMVNWFTAAEIDISSLNYSNTDQLLAMWKANYDPATRPKGMTKAERNYYVRLNEKLQGTDSPDAYRVSEYYAGQESTDALKDVTKTDYIRVSNVANVKTLPLGTDNFGRDMLKELVYAAGTSLQIGFLAGIVATLIGLTLGLLSGYLGGLVDDLIMFFTNVFTVIPGFVLLILISYSIGQEQRGAMVVALVIGCTSWTWTARSVRSQVISLRNRDHVNLSKLSGHSLFRIILTDILPYVASYVVMAFILQVSSGILSEAQLSLLGLGPKTTEVPTLGLMMNWAMLYSAHQNGSWWAYAPVILTITLISFSLNLMNTGLDQVFNPTLRD